MLSVLFQQKLVEVYFSHNLKNGIPFIYKKCVSDKGTARFLLISFHLQN